MIPARLSSKRLPNKVLLQLGDKTILQRVYEQCIKVEDTEVFIATDNQIIRESCLGFTDNIIMTSDTHKSGTDRIIEASKDIENFILVNVQGDEPFINPNLIKNLFKILNNPTIQIVTACERIFNSQELFNPNVVKVVKDINDFALYFSRSCMPYIGVKDNLIEDEKIFFKKNIFYKHIGIYGYSKAFLEKFQSLKYNNLECLESLEQLRILENGYKIKVFETKYKSIGIDTMEDYHKALEYIKSPQ